MGMSVRIYQERIISLNSGGNSQPWCGQHHTGAEGPKE